MHGPDLDKQYHFDASVFPRKPKQESNSAEAFMDRKPKKVKNGIFHEF